VTDSVEHPGTIVYVDGDTNETTEEDIANVPESLRFADTDAGPVPVVRVVARTAGNQRYIREYGPKGELLRSTVQIQDDVE
jgi:hypothetical protein